jgi:sodium transport system ATP-binding protein
MDQPILIEASQVSKYYGRMAAVSDVDFQVRGGEVFGLLGPNGAGKTTILRMIASILPPTSGVCRVCGYDTSRQSFAAKKHTGFLSGDTALYQRLTPLEIFRYFGRLYSMSEAEIGRRSDRLIEELRMETFINRPCGLLSSGEAQKVNIARAYLHDPAILILDEPTSSVDIITGRFILESIRRAKAAGKAILFSTHIMSEAELLCDRIGLLYQGRLFAEGSLVELKARTGQPDLTSIFLHLMDQSCGQPL